MFADIDIKQKQFDNKKTTYLKFTPGNHIIRILDSKAKLYFTHWINGISVLCLGEDCPICADNRNIFMKNPKEYKKDPSYIPSRKTYLVNVLDRTPAKVCPNCGEAVKKISNAYPQTCPSCNNFIVDVAETQLNQVKVLSRGVELFSELEALSKSVYAIDVDPTLPDSKPLPITSYDIMLVVSGSGREMKVKTMPIISRNDEVSVNKEDLFDLSNCIISLTPEEIVELRNGVLLKDIYMARKSKDDFLAEDSVDSPELKDSIEDIEKQINVLMGN